MIVAGPLVTLVDAKLHLRITDLTADADVQMQLNAATGIIIGYLKRPDHGWIVATVPAEVHQAILLQLAHLYEHRGDEPVDREDELAPGVAGLLRRLRDPALA